MLRIGVSPPLDGWRDHTHQVDWVTMVADAGIDHVFVADHVSFRGGSGMDGLIRASSFLSLHPRLGAAVGVYLLALRHPVTVARQIATISEHAPGRLVFGVGVGGEDRGEYAAVGVDAATRGRRTDEALGALRPLLAGEEVSLDGDFYSFERARVLPAPDPPVPILIGGRSEAALRRAARFGDGWLAAWVTPERFGESTRTIAETAAGRRVWQHGYQGWIGVGGDPAASKRLADAMESFYATPFERFERYVPAGRPEDVAAYLGRFVAAGCTTFNLTPVAESDESGIAAVAEIKRLLGEAESST